MPVIQGLVRWGFASLLPGGEDGGPETFDQTWAVTDAEQVADETYQWTVDGVAFELAVSGSSLPRTPGAARKPAARLSMTSAALDSVLGGKRTIAEAVEAGDIELVGPDDTIGRMFAITGFPAALHGF